MPLLQFVIVLIQKRQLILEYFDELKKLEQEKEDLRINKHINKVAIDKYTEKCYNFSVFVKERNEII